MSHPVATSVTPGGCVEWPAAAVPWHAVPRCADGVLMTPPSLGSLRSDSPDTGVLGDQPRQPAQTREPTANLHTQHQPSRLPRRQDASPEPGSNLFVSGLSSSVDDACLEAAFAPFGDILSAKVMLHVDTGVSRGFGFVLFRSAADAAAARVALQGKPFPGCAQGGRLHILVSRHRGENLGAESRVVYVRNVPTVGHDRLEACFAAFGALERIIVRSCAQAGGHGAGGHDNVSLVLYYRSPADARACVAATHGKALFRECTVPLLAKLEEPQALRDQRLKANRSSPSTSPGSALNVPAAAPAVATFDLLPSAAVPATAANVAQPTPPPVPFPQQLPPYAAPALYTHTFPPSAVAVPQHPPPSMPAGVHYMVHAVPPPTFAPMPFAPPPSGYPHLFTVPLLGAYVGTTGYAVMPPPQQGMLCATPPY